MNVGGGDGTSSESNIAGTANDVAGRVEVTSTLPQTAFCREIVVPRVKELDQENEVVVLFEIL